MLFPLSDSVITCCSGFSEAPITVDEVAIRDSKNIASNRILLFIIIPPYYREDLKFRINFKVGESEKELVPKLEITSLDLL